MKLVFGKFEGNSAMLEDVVAGKLVAKVFGHTEEEVASRRPNAAARLFAGSPGLREALQAVVDQGEAQFKAGDRYATFSKTQIAQFKEDLRKAVE